MCKSHSYDIKSIKKFAKENIDVILDNGVIVGSIVELMTAYNNKWKFVGATGYDHIDNRGRLIETKTTNKVQMKRYLRIGGVENKKGKCDVIQIHDVVNNREFRIPHDVFFKRAHLECGQLWWFTDYRTSRTTPKDINSELLLEYEV